MDVLRIDLHTERISCGELDETLALSNSYDRHADNVHKLPGTENSGYFHTDNSNDEDSGISRDAGHKTQNSDFSWRMIYDRNIHNDVEYT